MYFSNPCRTTWSNLVPTTCLRENHVLKIIILAYGNGYDDETEDGKTAADADEDVGQLFGVHRVGIVRRRG